MITSMGEYLKPTFSLDILQVDLYKIGKSKGKVFPLQALL